MKNLIIVSLIICAAVFFGAYFALKQPPKLGYGFNSTFDSTTIKTINVTSGVVSVVSSDANRKYLMIQNHTSGTLTCLLDGETTAASSAATSTTDRQIGFKIAGSNGTTTPLNSTFVLTGYIGGINCTSNATSTTSTVITSP